MLGKGVGGVGGGSDLNGGIKIHLTQTKIKGAQNLERRSGKLWTSKREVRIYIPS